MFGVTIPRRGASAEPSEILLDKPFSKPSPGAATGGPVRDSRAMKKAKSEYSIQTVINALRVLEAFEHAEEQGVTAISQALDLHKNSVFRLLATLEMKGYIEQTDCGKYRLGTRCFVLGKAYSRAGGDLLRRAGAALAALRSETAETVHLGILRNFEVVHLDGLESPQRLRVGSRVGGVLPAHCTALGKVLLACGPEETLRAYDRGVAATGGLEPRTPATISDRDKLLEHLRGVSVARLAVDLEECDPGTCCVAAPVFDESGRLAAALSVSGPSLRLTPDVLLGGLASAAAAAAERLSAELGHSSS